MIKKISLFLSLFLFLSLSFSSLPASASLNSPEDTIHAWGEWSFSSEGVNQSGLISFDFPPGGGDVSGHMTGGGDQFSTDMEAYFDGNFTGGWDGTFSGDYTGSILYDWVNPQTGATESSSAPINGTWSATVNKDGKMNITSNPSNAPSNSITANFDAGEFATELSLSEYDDENLMEGGIKEEGVAQVSGEMAYVIVDGERYDLEAPKRGDKNFQVRSGMTFGVEHDNGSLYLDIGEDHELFMSGIGEITVYLAEDIDESLWQDIVGMQPAGSIVTMQPGQVVVRYKPGSAESYWIPGEFTDDQDPDVEWGVGSYDQKVDNPEDQTEMTYIVLTTMDNRGVDLSVFGDAIGTSSALKDTDSSTPRIDFSKHEGGGDGDDRSLWGMLFGNESEVKYDYDGENLKVEVLEGRVTVFDTDFEGNSVIVAVVESGESYEVNIEEYYDEKLGEKDDEDDGDGDLILYVGIGAGILVLLIVIGVLVRRRK